jgi:AraC family transcriptional regulator, regulatory protein of adaptative response / methylated-DNA-[protein]-cysteine methyltransferase
MTLSGLDAQACYSAMCRRDARCEGVFFVGVKTTGVFCRPTCPAPPPKRQNCEYFANAQHAMLASYRPCKRCRPLSPPEGVSEVVRALVDAVEKDPLKRWRDADVQRLRVHAATARRQFKRRFGMTFVGYARARRLGEAFKAIRSGSRVISAQLDAGYESSSGFRDACAKIMSAPPSSTVTQMLFASWFDTPLGALVAVADQQSLYLLEYVDRRGLEDQIRRLRVRARAGIVPGQAPPIDRIQAQLSRYFRGELDPFATPRVRFGSAFQNAVWDALVAIPVGRTKSYAELACQIGRPKAVRAVAQANGANPFAIIVPCHRVIRSNGDLGGYGGEVWRKRWLLEHERQLAIAAGVATSSATQPAAPARSRAAQAPVIPPPHSDRT